MIKKIRILSSAPLIARYILALSAAQKQQRLRYSRSKIYPVISGTDEAMKI